MVDVQTNEEGLRPEHLQSIMENWPSDRPKPKALYTVPVRIRYFTHLRVLLTLCSSMAGIQQGPRYLNVDERRS